MNFPLKLDIHSIRKDFLAITNNEEIVYFDNAATTHKPQVVIDSINQFYSFDNANVHRGLHQLSQKATQQFEDARSIIAKFLNAKKTTEIIFTKGTTEGINMVASSFGELLKEGDEIIISTMEHHSNIVPWQILCERKKCILKIAPINNDGEIIIEEFDSLLNNKTKLIAVTHVSNALGTVNPIKDIIKKAHNYNAKVLIDGAQSTQHLKIDVTDLDCDFFVFSGHKVFGPTGIGVIYGKEELLERMPPYQSGGEMISRVTFKETSYNSLPYKFEAGTPNIAGAIGLAASIDYLSTFDLSEIYKYEQELIGYAIKLMKEIDELEIIGNASEKSSIISFNMKGVHPYDLGVLLNQQNIALRTGHHCTQPLMDFYKIPGTVRASFTFYNTHEEIDKLLIGIKKSIKLLK